MAGEEFLAHMNTIISQPGSDTALLPPDGISGEWRIETFEVSKADSDMSRIRSIMHPEEFVEAGTYKRLTRGQPVVMSNTRMERNTNRPILRMATGRVLINGLGLGMVPVAILAKPELTELWIVEKSPDVIALTGPTITKDPRVKLVNADAFEWSAPKGMKFDAVWHDIWDYITSENLAQMTTLKRRYARRCTWQGCWAEMECLRARRRGY